jgi:hypothetical protein
MKADNRPTDDQCARRAALAMLRYEGWLLVRPTSNGDKYPGETADAIITAHTGGDIHRWAAIAGDAIELATQDRGCSATARRIRGQRAKRSDQRTGRRTIPKDRRAA